MYLFQHLILRMRRPGLGWREPYDVVWSTARRGPGATLVRGQTTLTLKKFYYLGIRINRKIYKRQLIQ